MGSKFCFESREVLAKLGIEHVHGRAFQHSLPRVQLIVPVGECEPSHKKVGYTQPVAVQKSAFVLGEALVAFGHDQSDRAGPLRDVPLLFERLQPEYAHLTGDRLHEDVDFVAKLGLVHWVESVPFAEHAHQVLGFKQPLTVVFHKGKTPATDLLLQLRPLLERNFSVYKLDICASQQKPDWLSPTPSIEVEQDQIVFVGTATTNLGFSSLFGIVTAHLTKKSIISFMY